MRYAFTVCPCVRSGRPELNRRRGAQCHLRACRESCVDVAGSQGDDGTRAGAESCAEHHRHQRDDAVVPASDHQRDQAVGAEPGRVDGRPVGIVPACPLTIPSDSPTTKDYT